MIDPLGSAGARMRARVLAPAMALGMLIALTTMAACGPGPSASSSPRPAKTPTVSPTPSAGSSSGSPPGSPSSSPGVAEYPWHTDIVSTTFWVGEIFDPLASDGSQMISTYDSAWFENYGGCDGVLIAGECRTEPRTADNGYFPTQMTPRQNPFYLDLPFDDINDAGAFARRDEVVPWAGQAPYVDHRGDVTFSYLKNRWVQLRLGDRECFGQVEDAGPGEYDDAEYVFGGDDARPANARYGGAGLDVSPAITGCLGFGDLDGVTGRISWRFVEEADVPPGPWLRIVTTSQVQ